MATFELGRFIESPSLEQLDRCRKEDLFTVADHFSFSVPKQ